VLLNENELSSLSQHFDKSERQAIRTVPTQNIKMLELEPSEDDHPMQADKPVDSPKEAKEWKMPEI
jgi:hypothetical protein